MTREPIHLEDVLQAITEGRREPLHSGDALPAITGGNAAFLAHYLREVIYAKYSEHVPAWERGGDQMVICAVADMLDPECRKGEWCLKIGRRKRGNAKGTGKAYDRKLRVGLEAEALYRRCRENGTPKRRKHVDGIIAKRRGVSDETVRKARAICRSAPARQRMDAAQTSAVPWKLPGA